MTNRLVVPSDVFARAKEFLPLFWLELKWTFNIASAVAVLERESLIGQALRLRGPGLVGWGDNDGNAFRGFGACQKDLGGGGELLVRFGHLFGFDLWTPRGQARFIDMHLDSSRRIIRLAFPDLAGDSLEVAVFAGYNANIGRVLAELEKGRDPDGVTTGGDYGSHCLAIRKAVAPLIRSWILGDAL
jgi:hypothetical protein